MSRTLTAEHLLPGHLWTAKHPHGGFVRFLSTGTGFASPPDGSDGGVRPLYMLAIPVSRMWESDDEDNCWEFDPPPGDVTFVAEGGARYVAHTWREGPVATRFLHEHQGRVGHGVLEVIYKGRACPPEVTRQVRKALCQKRFEKVDALFEASWKSFYPADDTLTLSRTPHYGELPPMHTWGRAPETYRRRFPCGRQVEVFETPLAGWAWHLVVEAEAAVDGWVTVTGGDGFATAAQAANAAVNELASTAQLLTYR